MSPPLSRLLGYGLPLGLLAVLLLIDPAPLDFAIADLLYRPGQGFVGQHSALLEDLLHDRAKQAVILLGILAIVGFVLSLCIRRLHPWRRRLGYLVLAMGLSTGMVTPLKRLTAMHCPWSLEQYGGVEHFSALLEPRPVPVKSPGQCWPAGHAAAGFSLFALFFALRDSRPRTARLLLAVAWGLGCLFALSRMAQGAHFLSHSLWTAALCWLISLGLYDLLLYRPVPRLSPQDRSERTDRSSTPQASADHR